MILNKKESETLISLNCKLHCFMADILSQAKDSEQIKKAKEGFDLAFELANLTNFEGCSTCPFIVYTDVNGSEIGDLIVRSEEDES